MSSFTHLRPLLWPRPSKLCARRFSTSPSHSLAKIIVTGRLAADPEPYHTPSGREIVRYTVATSHGSKDNRQTSFFRISSFPNDGPQKDYLLSLTKGTLICVEGDATIGTWEDSEGRKQSALNIAQRTLEVLKRRYPDAGSESSSEGGHE